MTTCAVFQVDAVKNSDVRSRLTSVPRCPVIVTVTGVAGWEANATV